MPIPRHKHHDDAIKLMRAGKTNTEIGAKFNVPAKRVSMWRVRAGLSEGTRSRTKPAAFNHIADQLAIVAKMLREKLPDIVRFSVTTDERGKASVEYTLRQISQVTGKVQL